MAKICQAKIERILKHDKDHALYPTSPYAKAEMEDCGGEITFNIEVQDGGCCAGLDYCYCEPATIQINPRCTRCSCPYYEGISDLLSTPITTLERMLNG